MSQCRTGNFSTQSRYVIADELDTLSDSLCRIIVDNAEVLYDKIKNKIIFVIGTMKKIPVILLLFFYLIPVIGISVNIHYCGGELASVSLLNTGEHQCGCRGEMKAGCCDDRTHIFKVEDVQQTPLQLFLDFKLLQNELATFDLIVFDLNMSLVDVLFYPIHRPPDEVKQSLFILNRVLRV